MQVKWFEMILHALGAFLPSKVFRQIKEKKKKKKGDDLPGSEHEVIELTDF